MHTSDQLRAARALIRWDQKDLAAQSGVSVPTIKRLEAQLGRLSANTPTLAALRSALEAAGVEFIDDTGVKMRAVYFVISVRMSRGIDVTEGKYDLEADAIAHMDRLGDDPDCLLAEVQRWPVASAIDSAPERILFVAQAERIGDRWHRVEGDIRSRTIGGEAEEILRKAGGVT